MYDLPGASFYACHSLTHSQAAAATPAPSTAMEDCNMSGYRDSKGTPVCPEGKNKCKQERKLEV